MTFVFDLYFVAEKKKSELRLELQFWLIAWDGYMQAAAILKQVSHICCIFDESASGLRLWPDASLTCHAA